MVLRLRAQDIGADSRPLASSHKVQVNESFPIQFVFFEILISKSSVDM